MLNCIVLMALVALVVCTGVMSPRLYNTSLQEVLMKVELVGRLRELLIPNFKAYCFLAVSNKRSIRVL